MHSTARAERPAQRSGEAPSREPSTSGTTTQGSRAIGSTAAEVEPMTAVSVGHSA